MPKIQVVLNPERNRIGQGAQRVTGLRIDLNFQGQGNTLATSSPQPAQLNFFEAIGPQDDQSTHFLIATLSGTISLNGSTPVFNATNQYIKYSQNVRSEPIKSGPSYFPPTTSTDWFVQLAFNSTRFTGTEHMSNENRQLFLPWFGESGESGTLDVGVELTINGAQEFWFTPRNTVSIGCLHNGIHLDSNPREPRANFYGCGMAHPKDNNVFREFPNSRGRIKLQARSDGTRRLQINFHEGVNSLVKNWTRVIGTLREQFRDIGLIIDTEIGRNDAQANQAGFGYLNDTVLDSSGNQVRERTWMASSPNGADLPFFTYWVFYTHAVTSWGDAEGLSEGKISIQTTSPAAARKAVKYPIRLLGQLDTSIGNLGDDPNKDLHVANVLAHEIGHCLGFDHVLEAQPGNRGYRLSPSDPDKNRAIMAWENLGAFTTTRLRRFGPVHRDMIARDYF